MEFYSVLSQIGGVTTYPDWVFGSQPTPPSQMEDTEQVKASSTGGSISITGSVGN